MKIEGVSTAVKQDQPELGGLTGVAANGSGGMVEVYNKNGYKEYNKDELSAINKAAKGDNGASEKLKQLGVTLKTVSSEQGARSRNDLFAAGTALANGDSKKYDAFIKQQNAIGGHHMTTGAKITTGLATAATFGIGAVASTAALNRKHQYDGVQTVKANDGKSYQLSRLDGKSPTDKDKKLARKAADGDAAAKSECVVKGLMVTYSDPAAAKKRLEATPESKEAVEQQKMQSMTAGQMGGSAGVRV